MCKGEFEALKEIYSVSPAFVPQPYTFGNYVQKGANKELQSISFSWSFEMLASRYTKISFAR